MIFFHHLRGIEILNMYICIRKKFERLNKKQIEAVNKYANNKGCYYWGGSSGLIFFFDCSQDEKPTNLSNVTIATTKSPVASATTKVRFFFQ